MKRTFTILLFAFFVAFLVTNAQTDASKRKPKQSTTTAPSKPKPATSTSKPKHAASNATKQKPSSDSVSNAPRMETSNYTPNIKTINANGVSFQMIEVRGGTFSMGETYEKKGPNISENAMHQVTLTNDYYIGKTEVTQALWKAVMGYNPSNFKGDYLPVERVSWEDCQMFILKLNTITDLNFRLPTEAEWEFAARGGNNSKHYQFSGSNELDDVAWYYGNSGRKTYAVASKQPNELGIYDMSGNVWELCSDWYGSYSNKSQTNPTGPESGHARVDRGGSWFSTADYCRPSNRSSSPSGYKNDNIGFRLVLSE